LILIFGSVGMVLLITFALAGPFVFKTPREMNPSYASLLIRSTGLGALPAVFLVAMAHVVGLLVGNIMADRLKLED
jgi:hypothetical protein